MSLKGKHTKIKLNLVKTTLNNELLTGDTILLYGDISSKIIKHTYNLIKPNGQIFVIGRNIDLIRFNKFTRGKYKKNVIVNPYFETIPENTLNHILIANMSLNLNKVVHLAKQAHSKLKLNGQLIVIDNNISKQELIALNKNIPWFRLKLNSEALIFEKV
ncbi:MAG: hypothetical protein JEZ09_10400 [Salinivirgaceae bacterium]|nr:hypothetical protein [Salinivirgaceae bacterium]